MLALFFKKACVRAAAAAAAAAGRASARRERRSGEASSLVDDGPPLAPVPVSSSASSILGRRGAATLRPLEALSHVVLLLMLLEVGEVLAVSRRRWNLLANAATLSNVDVAFGAGCAAHIWIASHAYVWCHTAARSGTMSWQSELCVYEWYRNAPLNPHWHRILGLRLLWL